MADRQQPSHLPCLLPSPSSWNDPHTPDTPNLNEVRSGLTSRRLPRTLGPVVFWPTDRSHIAQRHLAWTVLLCLPKLVLRWERGGKQNAEPEPDDLPSDPLPSPPLFSPPPSLPPPSHDDANDFQRRASHHPDENGPPFKACSALLVGPPAPHSETVVVET